MRRNYMKDVIFFMIVILISFVDFQKINIADFNWKFVLVIFIILVIIESISFVVFNQILENSPTIYNKKIQLFYLLKDNDKDVSRIKDMFYEDSVISYKNEINFYYKELINAELNENADIIEAADKILKEGNFVNRDRKRIKKSGKKAENELLFI